MTDDRLPTVLPTRAGRPARRDLQSRLTGVVSARDRLRRLLDAVLVIGGELDLQTVLRRIVEAATSWWRRSTAPSG